MTKQQKIYYDAIKAYIAKNGCGPSYTDIAKMVGVRSLASVAAMLTRLCGLGYLVRDARSSRSVAIVPAKLHGFNVCSRNHEEIYFRSGICPLCTELQRQFPPRAVTAESLDVGRG